MKKKLLVAAGILVAAVAALGVFAPKEFKVEREVVVLKPKAVVFESLRLVRNHDYWSPWVKLDPNMTRDYRGVDGTVGFVSAWAGNDEVGVGEQEIVNIVEGERIDYALRFKEPMQDESRSYLVTEDAGEGRTKVRWGMEGKTPFPGNIVCLFMNIEGRIGKDFEEGLASLKSILDR